MIQNNILLEKIRLFATLRFLNSFSLTTREFSNTGTLSVTSLGTSGHLDPGFAG